MNHAICGAGRSCAEHVSPPALGQFVQGGPERSVYNRGAAPDGLPGGGQGGSLELPDGLARELRSSPPGRISRQHLGEDGAGSIDSSRTSPDDQDAPCCAAC